MMDIRKIYDFSKAVIKCDDENNPLSQLETGEIRIEIIVPKFGSDTEKLHIPKTFSIEVE